MTPTDQITIRRAINGDESALRAIWTQHAPRIDALVRRLVGDPDQAADVAQEVWIQIFRALPGYRARLPAVFAARLFLREEIRQKRIHL